MLWLDTIWYLVSALTESGPSGLATGAMAGVLLIAALAAPLLLHGIAVDQTSLNGRALRGRAERTGVPRHRDPDAPGRTRPRGPTRLPSAAV
ncbi:MULTISPECIES: DUF6412 domain-containing protein [Actinoplanes]|uniref:DUF6412 domain-containing protein n=1 Tax=Actinoplanes TaxID=1865 RepID=UPI0005F2B83A|nr:MULTISPECIES: DUF6412 domain-containing protein [Actinoplanes]GLY05731.1 hypothetical protein Acsp01_61100 [Actinoplanes sp. NBRC 101535]